MKKKRNRAARPVGQSGSTYRYASPTSSEQWLVAEVVATVTTDKDLLEMAASHHLAGDRCAVVVMLEGRELRDLYVTSANDAQSTFGQELVGDALRLYDPTEMICIIIARGDRVAAIAAPLIQG